MYHIVLVTQQCPSGSSDVLTPFDTILLIFNARGGEGLASKSLKTKRFAVGEVLAALQEPASQPLLGPAPGPARPGRPAVPRDPTLKIRTI